MENNPLRVGVIGTGHWATEAHLPGFQACHDVRVTAICSRSQERGEEVARAFSIPRVFTSAEAMVAAGELDLVSIVTPDDCHPADGTDRDRGRAPRPLREAAGPHLP